MVLKILKECELCHSKSFTESSKSNGLTTLFSIDGMLDIIIRTTPIRTSINIRIFLIIVYHHEIHMTL